MSSITGISGLTSAAQSYLTDATQTPSVSQAIKDFQNIAASLQSGNIAAAQTALVSFRQDLPAGSTQSTANQIFGKNTQASTDFQNLTTALQSGDLSGAQKAFSSLQTDLQAAHKGQHHHHAPAAASSTSATAATGSSASSTFGNILNTLLSPTN